MSVTCPNLATLVRSSRRECPNLATLVRSSRREANLTVSALAVRCGCSKSTISDIERGKTYNVGGLLLFELGAVLQLYGDDLLDAVYESSLNGAEPSEAEGSERSPR